MKLTKFVVRLDCKYLHEGEEVRATYSSAEIVAIKTSAALERAIRVKERLKATAETITGAEYYNFRIVRITEETVA